MSVECESVKAGLVFLRPRNIDIVAAGNRAGCTLEAFDGSQTETHVLSDDSVIVQSKNFTIYLVAIDYPNVWGMEQKVSHVLQATISRTQSCAQALSDVKESALAHVLVSLQRVLNAEHVQWLVPGAMLNKHEFAEATMQVFSSTHDHCERNAKRWKYLPTIDETNEDLLGRFSQKDVLEYCGSSLDFDGKSAARHFAKRSQRKAEIDDIREKTTLRRAAAWCFTAAVTLLYLPLGVSLIVFNLLRGENLRLSSQAAALTGMFVGFQTMGTTVQAMSVLQKLIY